ncbi:hypothetical protein BOX15_Mlig013033g1 [Macrostomum lignano]|uniref:RGS domain-containing protein n=1 Tax=Macrostomum lignano TaxID=282301 RepID=A0A267EY46_9PLAT|nr:hypothetical protein BOX15_Mlig013033g1 [Macrostomum lignano]
MSAAMKTYRKSSSGGSGGGNSDAQKQTQRALLKYNASSSSGGGGGGGGRNNRNGSRSHSGDAPDGPIGDEGGDGGGEARRGNKTCCFCWCCCCSCSCLSVKSNRQEVTPRQSGVSQTAKDISAFDFGSISKEEAKQWGESFDALMQSANGRKVFREYLKSEYSEENILFWLACEDLKLESTPEGVEEKARVIYEDYISILSPKEVSLDARVREIINKNMVEPTAHTFDDAQVQIFTLMHRDSYPRFLNSHFYRQLVSDGATTS